MPPKVPCSHNGCKKACSLIGDCSSCGKKFCGLHRLYEDHSCPRLEEILHAAHAAQADRIMADANGAKEARRERMAYTVDSI